MDTRVEELPEYMAKSYVTIQTIIYRRGDDMPVSIYLEQIQTVIVFLTVQIIAKTCPPSSVISAVARSSTAMFSMAYF